MSDAFQEVRSPLSYCPRSSLSAELLTWLTARLAHLAPRPSGLGGNPPLPLEVRLDAVGAVILDGLSYRRAGRMVGISKTEVGESMDLLLGELAALGCCQPDGTFIATLADLHNWLVEMADSGEAVCVDGLATRVQRPAGWTNQKVVYDTKRHLHTAQGIAVSTLDGDLLWCDGGWPGSCHEHEVLQVWRDRPGAGRHQRRRPGRPRVSGHGQDPGPLARPGRRPAHQGPAHRRRVRAQPSASGLRALVEQSISHLANAWALRRWRGLLYRVRDVYRAAAALISLARWLHRVPA